eukprot:GFYU01006589.1.p1 GENE.GFYU01006589.1~~GFYU01006589.1.p1  ORF type:complete len:135 (-),score=32.63 GFYU01006589.1:279-683(-)
MVKIVDGQIIQDGDPRAGGGGGGGSSTRTYLQPASSTSANVTPQEKATAFFNKAYGRPVPLPGVAAVLFASLFLFGFRGLIVFAVATGISYAYHTSKDENEGTGGGSSGGGGPGPGRGLRGVRGVGDLPKPKGG